MNNNFQVGDKKTHYKVVEEADFAVFDAGEVHEVCSTFALGREMEWASRLFVLEMKEGHEEGIGTMLEINHEGPAFEGERLELIAEVFELSGNELICGITVKVGERRVATGKTGQKVIDKQKLNSIFNRVRTGSV